MSCEEKNCVFVRNKSIKTVLTSNCFRLKYETIIHIKTSSIEKDQPLLSCHFKIQPHICLALFWTVFACKRCLICADFSLDSDQMTFSMKEALSWIEDYLSWKQRFEVKNGLMDAFLTNTHIFPSQDINWWTGVTCGLLWCFYQLFGLSFWRHPFTAEDPLLSKWCIATFLQICSDEETNSSTSWMTWGGVNFKQIFGWPIPVIQWYTWNNNWSDSVLHLNVVVTSSVQCEAVRWQTNLMWLFFQEMMWKTVEMRNRAIRPMPYTQAVIRSQRSSDSRYNRVIPTNAGTISSYRPEFEEK